MAEKENTGQAVPDSMNLEMFAGLGDVGLSEEDLAKLEGKETTTEGSDAPEKNEPEKTGEEDNVSTPDTELKKDDKPGDEGKEDKSDEDKKPTSDEDTKDEEDTDEALPENPFVKKQKKTEDEDIDLKDLKIDNIDALKTLFKQTGVEIKSEKDLKAVAEKFNNVASELETVKEQAATLKDYKTIFDKLPPDLFEPVLAYIKDEDYRDVMRKYSGSYLDFDKDFKDQDLKSVMNYYYPGKFSDEDYEDVENDKKMQELISTAEQRFKTDKQALVNKQQTFIDSQQEAQEKYKESFVESMNRFKKEAFVNDKIAKDISDIMKGGLGSIVQIFTDDSGNLHPDAAKRIAYAIYGEEAVKYYEKMASTKATKKAKSNAVEEVVSRSTGKARRSTGNEKDLAEEEAKKEVQRIVPSAPKSNF